MAVFTTQRLNDEGCSDRQIQRLVDAGELVRLRRGGFTDTLPGDAGQRHLRLVDATASFLGPETVFSHVSAAVLHGLPVPDDLLVRATATRHRTTAGGGNSRRHLRTYAGRLAAEDVTVVNGLPVTTVSRTASDLARVLGRRDAVVLLDAALHDPAGGELTGRREEIAEHLQRDHARRGFANACRRLALADGRAESVLETDSRLVFLDGGLPRPELQWTVVDADGQFVARCDMGWPECGVVGEADGLVKYGRLLRPGETTRDAVVREKLREDRIRGCGWLVRRWVWADLRRPEELCRSIEALFQLGRPLPRVA